MKRLLITGANGFLGSEVIRQANKAGIPLRATDQNEASPLSGIDYRSADILFPDTLKAVCAGATHVIHAAGLAHIFDRGKAATAPFKIVNEIGTANITGAATASGVRNFVLISSVAVYGPSTCGVYNESAPCRPEGPYAESKYQAERRAIEVAKETGMSLTILRLATLYGEGDPGNIARLTRTIDKGRFYWIGDGSNQKSLLHKEDAARAILKVAQTQMNGINIFNVSATPCTMREIVERLSTALGRQIPRWHIPASLAMGLTGLAARLVNGSGRFETLHDTVRKWLANDTYDTTKFERGFNFKTQVSLSDGLKREVDWYRKQNHST